MCQWFPPEPPGPPGPSPPSPIKWCMFECLPQRRRGGEEGFFYCPDISLDIPQILTLLLWLPFNPPYPSPFPSFQRILTLLPFLPFNLYLPFQPFLTQLSFLPFNLSLSFRPSFLSNLFRVGRFWILARDQVGLYGDTHNKKMTLKMKFIP